MVIRDPSGNWVPVRYPTWGDFVYYNQSEDFELMLVRNGWRKLPGAAKPNPDLAAFLPSDLPAEITAKEGWVVRMEPIHQSFITTRPSDVTELVYNIFPPIYLFTDAKARGDAPTDFFIYRYHSFRKNEATLLQFGEIGRAALATDAGATLLLSMLKLAESRLPGEYSPDFCARRNEFRSLVSRFYRAWCDADWALKDAVLCSYYAGKAKEFDPLSSNLSAVKSAGREPCATV